jgi:hypothetical protein
MQDGLAELNADSGTCTCDHTVRSLPATALNTVVCVFCAVMFAVVQMDSDSQWIGTADVQISIASDYCYGMEPALQRPPYSRQLLSLPFSPSRASGVVMANGAVWDQATTSTLTGIATNCSSAPCIGRPLAWIFILRSWTHHLADLSCGVLWELDAERRRYHYGLEQFQGYPLLPWRPRSCEGSWPCALSHFNAGVALGSGCVWTQNGQIVMSVTSMSDLSIGVLLALPSFSLLLPSPPDQSSQASTAVMARAS